MLSLATGAVIADPSARAAPLQYPDLRNVIPPSEMSIVENAGVREFRYTHDIYNAGPGPLEIQPVYSSAAGNYRGFQDVYSLASGNWSLDLVTRVAGAFEFHAEHGHFHFPLASFGLYSVASDGGVGAPIVLSPKNGFCIDNSFLYAPNVPNAGAFLNHGPCTDPTSLRGLTVGYVDEYDYRDPGQSIPIDGLPDGTYWFRAFVDPLNYIAEADESNNITDVEVRITGNVVETLTPQITTADSTPPAVDMTSPADGDYVSGIVTLTSSSPTPGVVGVQYLVDGQPLAGAVGPGPDHPLDWDTQTVTNGSHWMAAQATDGSGLIGTSAVVELNVANTPPPPPGDLSIDQIFATDGQGSVTDLVSSSGPDRLLLAFVAGDGPNGTPQTATVSGGGLAWTLERRANAQNGTSEIWKATAADPLAGASITSTLAHSGYYQSLTVVAFEGAEGVGASAGASAASGAPSVQYAASADGSWGFGVGNDWDSAVPRTLPSDQTEIHEYLAPAGDTFWVQSRATPVDLAGTLEEISVVAPTDDQWNLAVAEVLPAPPSQQDVTPPTVELDDPADGSTVSGIVTLAATATDAGGIGEVEFFVDNVPLGLPLTTPPFIATWDTRPGSGPHTLTATATDLAGNSAESAPVHVTADNSLPPPEPIGVDATVFQDAQGILTTPSFSTTGSGDLLVAFVAYDGPATGQQTATVSGAGLSWSLVKRSNSQPGTSELWSALATGPLSSVAVSASPGSGGYHGALVVVAFTNAAGTGVAGAAGATSGEPSIYLPGISTGNWVWAVGNDWDAAIPRTPASGQVVAHQRLAPSGDTFWVQRTDAPTEAPGIVTIRDSAPTADRWNYAAVEIIALPEPGPLVSLLLLAPVVVGLGRRRRANRDR
jgi:Bacterial Ig domain/Lysyl oxidase